ncbi:amidohydrolase family protein [Mycobacterium xenopi 3993]|nr:amidohydrolase family protein [Mycobacterium xenopi 3993]
MEHGARPVRRDAARLLGHQGPHRRHGLGRHLGVAELPVADRRVLRHGVLEEQGPELGLAVLRAWNDWHLEVWAGSFPERIIPLQLPWLADPQLAADEVRRNAERGFKAVSFPELPAQCGLPSLHTGVWDPFFAACEETDTVVCLHTGSAQWAPIPAPDTPFETITTLFPVNGLVACADMLWSGVPVRFPRLNITLAEGGLGWAAMLADRADYVLAHSASGRDAGSWKSDLLPSEVLHRNFWFCSIDDPHAFGRWMRLGPTAFWSKATIRTPTLRGRTPNRWWRATSRACPPRTPRGSRTATPPSFSATRCRISAGSRRAMLDLLVRDANIVDGTGHQLAAVRSVLKTGASPPSATSMSWPRKLLMRKV